MKRMAIFCLWLSLTLASTLQAQAPPIEPLKIEVWHAFGGDLLPYLDRMVADFNQTHPEYAVQLVAYGSYEDTFSALEQVLTEPEEGQTPPHLVHVSYLDTQLALDSGFFSPIQPVSGYFEGLVNPNNLPVNVSLPVLYANANLLEAAQIETLPTTMAELTEVCTVLQAANTPCVTWAIDAWLIDAWLGAADYASPRMTEIMTWWSALAQERYYVTPRQLGDWETANTSFLDGKVALLIGSTEDAFRLYNTAEFPILTATLPEAATDGYIPRGGGLWLVAGKPTEEQIAAQTFMAWLTNTENTVRWAKGSGYLPTRPLAFEILQEQDWQTSYPALMMTPNQLMTSASYARLSGAQREIYELVAQHAQLILGGREIERTLTALNDQITRAQAAYLEE